MTSVVRTPVFLLKCLMMFAVVAVCFPNESPDKIEINFQTMISGLERNILPQRRQVIYAWQQLLTELEQEAESTQIEKINSFFHSNVRYDTDLRLYGVEDYWATPAQTLSLGRGDCEDYAIAKYISLRRLGIADEKLRLIYVRARIGGARSNITEAHMVLGYYATPDAEPLILDSLLSQILPASERPDLTPVFSFNIAGLWAGQGNQRAQSSPVSRLSRWSDVLLRMEQEGIKFN